MMMQSTTASRLSDNIAATLKMPLGPDDGDNGAEVEIRVVGDRWISQQLVIEALRAAADAGRIRVVSLASADGIGGRRLRNDNAWAGFLGFLDADDHWVPVY